MADALASMREVASYSPAVSMARLLEQIDDVPPPGYLPKASRLARVARPGGEHWSCCPASVPAASRDQLGVSPNARRSSPGASPSTRTIFSRERSPRTTLTRPRAMPARLAISLQSAAFAWPSTGAAATLTRSTPSRSETIALRFARDCRRTVRSTSGTGCYAPDVRTPVFSDPAAPPLTRTRSQSGTKQ